MEHIHNSEKMRQAYEEELEDLNATISSLMKDLRAKESEIAVLTSSLNKMSEMVENLKLNMQELKNKEDIITRLQEQMAETGEDLARVSKLVHEKEMSLTLLQDKQSSLQMEIRALKQENSKLEIEVMSREEMGEGMRSKIKTLQTDLEEAAGKASSLEMSLQLEIDARLRAERLAVDLLKQQKDKEGIASLLLSLLGILTGRPLAGLEALYSNSSHLSQESAAPLSSYKLASLYDSLAVHEKHAKYWEDMRKSLHNKIHELDRDSIASLVRPVLFTSSPHPSQEAADPSSALKLESGRSWELSHEGPARARGERYGETPDHSRQEIQTLIETVETILRRD
eukprot:749818-Hanusia_phi.AAC.5